MYLSEEEPYALDPSASLPIYYCTVQINYKTCNSPGIDVGNAGFSINVRWLRNQGVGITTNS